MKSSLLSILSSISLIAGLTITTNVRANTVANQQEQQISAEELAIKKQVLSNLGAVARAQQAYFLEKNYFATQIKDLGVENNIENSVAGYQWQIFTDPKAKQVIMTVLTPKLNNSRTYVNFVNVTKTSIGNELTFSTVCESVENRRVVPQLPTKMLPNQGVECPSGFREFTVSETENALSERFEQEKQQRILVGVMNILQKQYYSRHGVFADKIATLFATPISNIEQKSGYDLRFLSITDRQTGIITIAALPNQKHKTYLGVITANGSSICEVSPKVSLDLEKLSNLPAKNLLNCGAGLVKVSLSAEETADINKELDNLNKYQAQIAEIENPRKTKALQTADQLAQAGQYLQAQQEYYLSLGALGISEYDLLGELTGESSFNPVRDSFLKKITPVLQAAAPLLLEQKQAIIVEVYNSFDELPKSRNKTAIKIRELAASQLGFNILTTAEEDLKIPDSKKAEFLEVSELLRQQFDDQTQQIPQTLPTKLRSYVNQHSRNITRIRNLLLTEETPTWGLDYKYIKDGDFQAPIPSYLGIVNLQRLLLIDVLEQLQKGNNQEMLKSLEASWKLSESLQNEPSLIGQLVNIIIRRSQIRVMQKIGKLPVVWQGRLLAHDYTKSLLHSLNNEAFSILQGLDKIIPPEKDTPLRQIYRNWYGVNTYTFYQGFYQAVEREKNNLCSVDVKDMEKQYFPYDNSMSPSYVTQIFKAHYLMLESEMMQKVLQLQTSANSPVEIPANVCLGNKWIYQTLPNGKRSISLDKQPIWLSQIKRSPLNYTW
ncbi:hypothetical protein CLI64_10965 [Nostoc sp. CENA543]|nr:hypothetical protein CLI64_10965 [Nostoc sp. CENA543]